MKDKRKIVGSIVIILIFLFFVFIGYFINKQSKADSSAVFTDESSEKTYKSQKNKGSNASAREKNSESKTICVEIKGAVRKPGVYTLDDGSIVLDLVKKAGGYANDADTDNLVQCTKLKSGDCIKVYKKGEKGAQNDCNTNSNLSNISQGTSAKAKIDINSANEEELDSISGIGKTRAEKIIEYREKNGPFKSPEDLKNIGIGIGEKTFEKIKDQIETR